MSTWPRSGATLRMTAPVARDLSPGPAASVEVGRVRWLGVAGVLVAVAFSTCGLWVAPALRLPLWSGPLAGLLAGLVVVISSASICRRIKGLEASRARGLERLAAGEVEARLEPAHPDAPGFNAAAAAFEEAQAASRTRRRRPVRPRVQRCLCP